MIAVTRKWPDAHPREFLAMAVVLWVALYWLLAPTSEALVAALPVDRESHLGGALQFFLYDTPKVLLLLTGVVFVMGMVQLRLYSRAHAGPAGGTQRGRWQCDGRELGIVTPFCSCSAVPLFIGFV